MKRIDWTVLVLGAALAATGCPKPGANQPANRPPEPEFIVPENVDGQKVTNAIGRALLKGVTTTEAPQPDDEAPSADP